MGEPLTATQTAQVYLRLLSARVRGDWQYRASFVMLAAVGFFGTFLDFATIAVLYQRVPTLGGWTLAEAALLYGVASVAFQFGDAFISQVEQVAFHIRQGTFDHFLVRPLGSLVQLCANEFAIRRIPKIAQGALVLTVAITQVDVAWTPARVAALVAAVASGTVIFACVWIIACSAAFWIVDIRDAAMSVVNGGFLATQYPLDVFGGWVRGLLLGVIPLGFVSYVPVAAILGRPLPAGSGSLARAGALAPAAVAVVLVVLARAVWSLGVRHYRGAGS